SGRSGRRFLPAPQRQGVRDLRRTGRAGRSLAAHVGVATAVLTRPLQLAPRLADAALEPRLPTRRPRRRLPDRLREALRPADTPASAHPRGAPRRRSPPFGQRDRVLVGPARHQRDRDLVAPLPALLPWTRRLPRPSTPHRAVPHAR